MQLELRDLPLRVVCELGLLAGKQKQLVSADAGTGAGF